MAITENSNGKNNRIASRRFVVLLGNIKVLDTFVASKFGRITHTNILPSVVVTYLLSVLLKASES
jgi:hypothetical protein